MLERTMFLRMKTLFLNWGKQQILSRKICKLIVIKMMASLQVVKTALKKTAREKSE